MPIYVTYLTGSPEQKAELYYRKWSADGHVPDAVKFFTGFAMQTFDLEIDSIFPRIIAKAIASLQSRRLVQKLHPELSRFWSRYGSYYGMNESSAVQAVVAPDVLAYILAKVVRFTGTPAAAPLGCSSVMIRQNGQVAMHGRNLDYAGGQAWPGHEVVIDFPENGVRDSQQTVISVGAAGVYLPGLTSLNDAGLFVSIHMLFSTRGRFTASPVLSLAYEAVRTCRTVADVRAFLAGKQMAAGWAIIASDAKGDAAVFEADGVSMSEYPVTGSRFGYVNACMTEIRQFEKYTSHAWSVNNATRKKRLETLLHTTENVTKVTADQVCSILSDSVDCGFGAPVPAGNTISNALTVSSVLYDREAEILYVGDVHSSAASTSYHGISVPELLQQYASPQKHLVVTHPLVQEVAEARSCYTRAGYAMQSGDISRSLLLLKEAHTHTPDSYVINLYIALLSARMGDYPVALMFAHRVASMDGLDAYRYDTAQLVLAMIKDVSGQRFDAISRYRALISNSTYPEIRRKARKHSFIQCRDSALKHIRLHWFTSHVIIF